MPCVHGRAVKRGSVINCRESMMFTLPAFTLAPVFAPLQFIMRGSQVTLDKRIVTWTVDTLEIHFT